MAPEDKILAALTHQPQIAFEAMPEASDLPEADCWPALRGLLAAGRVSRFSIGDKWFFRGPGSQ